MRFGGFILSGLYMWLFFVPVFAVMTVLMGTSAWLLGFVSTSAGSFCGVIWGRVVVSAGFVHVRVHGREHLQPGRQYVVMCNHRSHIDALVLYGWLGFRFYWVMKQELRKVPFLGPACARIGHIFIDRRDREQAVRSLREGLARAAGSSVLFFPEGTRSSTPDLLPFKKGGFVLAADAGLPILPMSLSGTERVLPNRSLRVRPFRRVDLRFHPPVPPPAAGDATAREAWIADVRAIISAGLGGTPQSATSSD